MRPAAGLHASRDSLYRTAVGGRQDRAGVAEISLAQLPRRCPICDQDTIIGHGRRRKQAHDEQHDWIWVRRGRCPRARRPSPFCPPGRRRTATTATTAARQAWDARQRKATRRRTARTPRDCRIDSTLRRWAWRKFVSLWCWVDDVASGPCSQTFSAPPPSLPGIVRRPAVFCVWRQTRHECSRRRRSYSSSRFRCWITWSVKHWKPARRIARGRLMGLCPLHADRKPSLLVDPGKSLFYCYGCGRGGDVIRFVELSHGVPFGEAHRAPPPLVRRGLVAKRRRSSSTRSSSIATRKPSPTWHNAACTSRSWSNECASATRPAAACALADEHGLFAPRSAASRRGHREGLDTFAHRIIFPLDANLYGRSLRIPTM